MQTQTHLTHQNAPRLLFVVRSGLVVGRAQKTLAGTYIYIPFNCAQQRSRKGWPTPEAAIGRRAGAGYKILPAVNLAHALALVKEEQDVEVLLDKKSETL